MRTHGIDELVVCLSLLFDKTAGPKDPDDPNEEDEPEPADDPEEEPIPMEVTSHRKPMRRKCTSETTQFSRR